jgi:hypothetical protein
MQRYDKANTYSRDLLTAYPILLRCLSPLFLASAGVFLVSSGVSLSGLSTRAKRKR